MPGQNTQKYFLSAQGLRNFLRIKKKKKKWFCFASWLDFCMFVSRKVNLKYKCNGICVAVKEYRYNIDTYIYIHIVGYNCRWANFRVLDHFLLSIDDDDGIVNLFEAQNIHDEVRNYFNSNLSHRRIIHRDIYRVRARDWISNQQKCEKT